MRALLSLLLSLFVIGSAVAQTPKSKPTLTTEINTNFADNTSGNITPAIARSTYLDMLASWQQFNGINAQTGTTYTVATSDYGQLITFSNASPIAVTIPQATGSFSSFNFYAKNLGAGTVTLTPTTSTINGAASISLPAGQALWILSDGTNYQVAFGGTDITKIGSTANQIPVYQGGANQYTVPTSATTWFDNAYCNTVGYFLARFTGSWTCSQGIPVNATWFGVVADGSTAFNSTNATANSTPLQNAIATNQCVFFPANSNGYSLPSNVLVIGTGQCIINPSQVFLKAQPATNGWVFHITASETTGSNAYLDNMRVDTTGAGTGTTIFRFASNTASVIGVQISRILCTHAFECIGDEASASNFVQDVKLYDIRCELTLGRQIHIGASNGFIWVDTLRVDNTQSGQTVPIAWGSVEFDSFNGLEVNRLDILSAPGTTLQSQTSFLLSGTSPANAFLNRINITGFSGNGAVFNGVTGLYTNWLNISGGLGQPLNMTIINNGNMSNTFISGGKGLTGSSTNPNIQCGPCNNLNFSNIVTTNSTGDGFGISAAGTGVSVSGIQTLGNTGFGINLSGGDFTVIEGGFAQTNTAGNVSNTSGNTHNRIQDVAGYNPVGVTGNITVGTSPNTICAGVAPETHYFLQSATNTATVKLSSTVIGTMTSTTIPITVDLHPNECEVITWTTTAPVYTKSVH